ncbi:MAG: PLP-dependent aminotransferase family protein [Bacteroidetes bacterium]|jgi:GntR family transcriptional regulator/MocR family aminotransferase|nr:PLP-dependent aminotransferase family protein [Bacteroidota bacterium]
MSIFDFIKIDKSQKEPVYLQIVYQTINAIRMERLEAGKKLPGTRAIAKELGIHRNTVVAAIEELKTQDWVVVVANVGTYVNNIERKSKSLPKNKFLQNQLSIPFYRNNVLEFSFSETQKELFFTDGIPDYRLISPKELSQFYSNVLKRKKRTETKIPAKNFFFYEQLCNYLNVTRGFSINKKNILCGNSREMLLNVLSQMLIKNGDVVAVAEYNHYNSNMIFRQNGAKIITIPMGQNGIITNYIENNFKTGEIKILYINSQNQYPTTCNMTTQRKKELLNLATKMKFVIIEDDLDFELGWYNDTPNTLYKQNQSAWIIYIGSFGRFLIPGFQTYFIVGTDDIISEANKYFSYLGNFDYYKEQALAEMITEGDIFRYTRKVLKTYQERKKMFAQLLHNYFNDTISYEIPNGGLSFWIIFNIKISLVQLSEKCNELGLYLPKNCLYQNQKHTAIRLGYAHLNEIEMKKAVQLLHLAITNLGNDFVK